MDKNKETIEALNDLLQGEYMAVESFNVFISRIEDDNIKEELKAIQSQHRENIETLSNYILDIDGKPDENIGFKGKMGDIMLNMELGSESDASEVIKKAIDGEIKGIGKTEEILRGQLDKKSKKIAESVLDKDRESIDKLKNLLS